MIDPRTVVLVEGASDKSAIETLAQRRGVDLAAEGISLVSMGGATNIGTYVGELGPPAAGCGWPACATPGRKSTSAGPWSAPGSAPAWARATWRRSGSSCASPTWRTS
ncbi:TOPRIM nucleotidyl transferase/hydrolase domain-containing protein [Nonomuraea thailandensis]